MTAQFDGNRKMIYFFTSKNTELGQIGRQPMEASLIYSAKGHDLFSDVEGTIHAENDPVLMERLWNRRVASWFDGGKTDPKLCLLHFEPGHARIWNDASSPVAGAKLFLGLGDPEETAGIRSKWPISAPPEPDAYARKRPWSILHFVTCRRGTMLVGEGRKAKAMPMITLVQIGAFAVGAGVLCALGLMILFL